MGISDEGWRGASLKKLKSFEHLSAVSSCSSSCWARDVFSWESSKTSQCREGRLGGARDMMCGWHKPHPPHSTTNMHNHVREGLSELRFAALRALAKPGLLALSKLLLLLLSCTCGQPQLNDCKCIFTPRPSGLCFKDQDKRLLSVRLSRYTCYRDPPGKIWRFPTLRDCCQDPVALIALIVREMVLLGYASPLGHWFSTWLKPNLQPRIWTSLMSTIDWNTRFKAPRHRGWWGTTGWLPI